FSRCSDNKTASMVRPRELALRWPYLQVNRPDMMSFLVFDVDHPNAWIWCDKHLPAPNLIVRNPHNGHAHFYYKIHPVCLTENARQHPIRYMTAVYKALAQQLQADPCYSGPVAKTPYHPDWVTTELHHQQYELGELADSLELETPAPWAKNEDEDTSHSRNCTLFNKVRDFAYRIVTKARERGVYEDFHTQVTQYAEHHNQFAHQGWDANLPESEVKALVKSVASWTWHHYVMDCAHRGIMGLDPSLPLTERQALSARRTHQERSAMTAKAIVDVVKAMMAKSERFTLTLIAERIGKTRQTVAKYTNLIEILKNRPEIIQLGELLHQSVENVKYGVSDNCGFDAFLLMVEDLLSLDDHSRSSEHSDKLVPLPS
ncbi:replication initiation protein, partial [Vibrio navarrensis]